MSKNISISEDVYERLKQEKGEKSFSEVIAEKLDDGNSLEEVTGQHILKPGTHDEVKTEIGQLSKETMERFDDETA